MQTTGEHPRAGGLDLGVERVDLGEHLLHHLRIRHFEVTVVPHREQVLRHVIPP